ncbi:MAG: hypothetical protein R2856_21520 [Caldilineaceae bacterium]
MALYDAETGARLPVGGQDFVHVAQVDVRRGLICRWTCCPSSSAWIASLAR